MTEVEESEFEQPEFDKQVPVGLIEDENLANVVGFAEKDHTETALEAVKHGLYREAVKHFELADIAGKVAGDTYLKGLQVEPDAPAEKSSDAAVETETSLERFAADAKQVLAERFKCSAEDFGVFTYKGIDGKTVNAVTYAAVGGLDLGSPAKPSDTRRSYAGIMDDNSLVVTINGAQYDTRTMTFPLYEAFVVRAKAEGKELPDRIDDSMRDKHGSPYRYNKALRIYEMMAPGVNTWTLLPGEPIVTEGPNAYDPSVAATENDGSVVRDHYYNNSGGMEIFFRPTVIFDDLQ